MNELKAKHKFTVFFFLLLVFPPWSAWAGPEEAMTTSSLIFSDSPLIVFFLILLFLPFIIHASLKEKFAEIRAKKDLRFMCTHSPLFCWKDVKEQIASCFLEVHGKWSREDLDLAKKWMTNRYWQSQQYRFLERWQQQGLINICTVRNIASIRPLLFQHRNGRNAHHGSALVVSIRASMNDYLEEKRTGTLVEGTKQYREVENIWTFILVDNQWKLAKIEAGNLAQLYARRRKQLPEIKSTLVGEQ